MSKMMISKVVVSMVVSFAQSPFLAQDKKLERVEEAGQLRHARMIDLLSLTSRN
jgi:hypothetical protein